MIKGARQHNLRNVDVRFPLGVVTAVTGVSGSGKSSLVEDILWKAAAKALHRAQLTPGRHESIEGLEQINKVISVDQSPLGSTPNSTPATYSGAFDLIRELFAKLPEAKVRGYTSRRFSFNQAGGRCEACEGAGQKRIEMHFLPDVWITCDACGGARYTPETLAVKFHGKSIADVLDMSVAAALELFANVPRIRKILQTLADVGLGYLSLGQSAPTLSGGEAQRVKLAAELSRPDTGKTLYILDEPTTGLHFDDVRKLLDVLHRLADLGNTVVVIEHNLDVIKTADWLIDLGPEAGFGRRRPGRRGTPEAIVQRSQEPHRPVPQAGPRRRPEGRAAPVRPQGRGPRGKYGKSSSVFTFSIQEGQRKAGARLERRGSHSAPGSPGPLGSRRPEVAYPRPGRRQRTPGALGWANPRNGRGSNRGNWRAIGLATTEWSQRGVVRISIKDEHQDQLPLLPRHHVVGVGRHTSVLRPEEDLPPRMRWRISSNSPRSTRASRPCSATSPGSGSTDLGGFQEITIVGHAAADFDTPGFDAFLKKAVSGFLGVGTSSKFQKASELSC